MAKKLNGVSSTLTIIFAIFLIACSDSPPSNTNDGETDSVRAKLPELPEAIGGMLSEEKYADMPNREVTEENLHEFIAMFRVAKGYAPNFSAITKESDEKGISKRIKREREMRGNPERARSGTVGGFEFGGFTIPDGQGGSIVWEWTYRWTERETAVFYELTERGTERFQATDYSRGGRLFFGQALSLSFYEYWLEDENTWKEIKAGMANGKMMFRGEFAGVIEYNSPYYKETWRASGYESLYDGEIVIGGGTNRINIPLDDWWEFLALL